MYISAFPTHLRSYKCLVLGKTSTCKSSNSLLQRFLCLNWKFIHWVHMMPVGTDVRELPSTDVWECASSPHAGLPAPRAACSQLEAPAEGHWSRLYPAVLAPDPRVSVGTSCCRGLSSGTCPSVAQDTLQPPGEDFSLLPALGTFQLHCDALDFTNSG